MIIHHILVGAGITLVICFIGSMGLCAWASLIKDHNPADTADARVELTGWKVISLVESAQLAACSAGLWNVQFIESKLSPTCLAWLRMHHVPRYLLTMRLSSLTEWMESAGIIQRRTDMHMSISRGWQFHP